MNLNYRGDRRNFDPDQLYGPDLHGARYVAVEATYDADQDRTAIRFRSLGTAELLERVANRGVSA